MPLYDRDTAAQDSISGEMRSACRVPSRNLAGEEALPIETQRCSPVARAGGAVEWLSKPNRAVVSYPYYCDIVRARVLE